MLSKEAFRYFYGLNFLSDCLPEGVGLEATLGFTVTSGPLLTYKFYADHFQINISFETRSIIGKYMPKTDKIHIQDGTLAPWFRNKVTFDYDKNAVIHYDAFIEELKLLTALEERHALWAIMQRW